MRNTLQIFSQRLREERKIKGFTQQALADKLVISLTTYNHYECLGKENGRQPPFEILVEICKILDVKADYLLGLED